MQTIETGSNKWSKAVISEKQSQIIELCRYIKEDLTTYQERFDHVTNQCVGLFDGICNVNYQVMPLKIDHIISNSLNESVFKTKIRNFLDVFQTKSDTEEDLGNSDDEEEDEEEEDLEEEDLDEEEDLEDIEDEEDEEDEEMPTSEPAMVELDDSSDEEDGSSGLKRIFSAADDDEEDEIEEDGEDELEDDDDAAVTKRRRVTVSDD